MVSRKTVCLRRLGGDRRGELQAGRFFASAKVTAARLVAGWSDRTGVACAGRHVLAIQDRCEVKFPTTAQRRRGLGPVGKGNAYGVLVHAMIAVDATSGSCLGLVGGDVWSRDGVNPIPHRQRPLAERESVHWVDTAQQAKQVLKPAAIVTVVADREADIYPSWASVPEANVHLLGRAMKDRLLAGGGTLFAAATDFPATGRRKVALPARDPGRPKRTAVVRNRTQRSAAEKSVTLVEELAGEITRAVYNHASLTAYVQQSKREVNRVKRYVDSILFDLVEISK
jgi:hypothetical protein